MVLHNFIKREGKLIKCKILSLNDFEDGFEKIPNRDDLKSLKGESLNTAIKLIEEFRDFNKKENKYSPEKTMSSSNSRTQSIRQGGYGTWREQMEFIYDRMKKENMTAEQAWQAWAKHIDIVKRRFPKKEGE